MVVLAVAGILAASVGGYFWWTSQKTIAVPQNFRPNYTKQVPDSKPIKSTSSADKLVYVEAIQGADWKTYTNNKYAFSLKYPANWKLEEAVYYVETIVSVSNLFGTAGLSFNPGAGPGIGCSQGMGKNSSTITPQKFTFINKEVTLTDDCFAKSYKLLTKTTDGKNILVSIGLKDANYYPMLNEVLKSVKGLTPVY